MLGNAARNTPSSIRAPTHSSIKTPIPSSTCAINAQQHRGGGRRGVKLSSIRGEGRRGGGGVLETCPKGPLPAAFETSCPEVLSDEQYLSMHSSSNSLHAQAMQSARCTTRSICCAEGDRSPAPREAITDHPSQAAASHSADSNSTPEAEPVTGVPLSIPFQLRSADGLQTPFTNYVRGYSGLLDYVWFEPSRLKVDRAIPLPSLEEVQGYLPSQRFPSDHLSVSPLCCC